MVTLTVAGQIAHPVSKPSPYRIGHDGIPRILPGSGGVVLSHRIGDRCVGLEADHVEPGVSIKNMSRSAKGDKEGENLALNTYACVGNIATVLDGPARNRKGLVTGKHGGVNHVLVDFPPKVLRALRIGDRLQINAVGTGLRLLDHPGVELWNCDPRLVARWGIRTRSSRLQVPVTHIIPAAIMGSGVGRNNALRGDYDIQLTNPELNRRLRLDTLRFGDCVAVIDADTRYGRTFRKGSMTIGIVVHSDSTVAGHGPGVVTLMTGDARRFELVRDERANLALMFGVRPLSPAATRHRTLAQKTRLRMADQARKKVPARAF